MWVDRRSAFVTRKTSGIGGGQSAGHMIGRLGATRATSVFSRSSSSFNK